MPESHIRFSGVWKRFRRGEIHDSLRDLLPALSRRLVRLERTSEATLKQNEFWAVRDVSFDVGAGQALGIIGGNGAGKSTCLKLLTRILRPTRGAIDVHGRIGSLIEISAGFHQDLTGRENVFLQGSIMGMPVQRIREKFDEIVEFSGITEFLDTPVKRYSSGMQARLGFSIAAHLDPDVLIIDEVLAVGDFRFQDRAFGRIRDLVRSGIPVVIVSHQLDRIATLCTDALVLERGVVAYRGGPADCIGWYLGGNRAELDQGEGHAGIQLHGLMVTSEREVRSGGTVELELGGRVMPGSREREQVVFRIRSAATGAIVGGTDLDKCRLILPEQGDFGIGLSLDLNLRPGVYAVETYVVDRMTSLDVAAGPIAYAQVTQDAAFVGQVQLRPTMRLLDLPPSKPVVAETLIRS